MKISQVQWATVGKAVAKEYGKDDVSGLAAEMAYYFILAIFPFIIFLASLAGFVGALIGEGTLFDTIMGTLYGALPTATADALRGPLGDVLTNQRAGALSIGAILALWTASNGMATIMKALNRAYGVEDTRNFVVKKALAVGMTLALSFLLILGFVLLLLGGFIGDWLAATFGLGGLFQFLWILVRIVGVLGGISLALAFIYWKGPNVAQQFKWISPGSLLTTVVWVIATIGFGLYVRLLGASSYSKTYGSAFGLILFLFYLYITSTVLVLGAEFNAETAKRYDPETIRDKMSDPAKQVPGEQPAPHPQAAREAGVSRQQVLATNTASASKLASGKGGPVAAPSSARASSDGSASVATGKDHSGEGRPKEKVSHDGATPASGTSTQDVPITPGPRLAESAEPSHRDPTKIATMAVSAATIAGAIAIGALHHKDQGRD